MGRQQVTVVGGGLGGLVAAIEAAERGAGVRLLEARRHLGGRATTAPGAYGANLGPHALYTGGSLWSWLEARDLAGPAVRPRPTRLRFRSEGSLRRTPPAAVLRLVTLRRAAGSRGAPVDRSFTDWAEELVGPSAAAAIAGAAGNLTFDHDPGRLSAAFVWERFERITLQPLVVARYVVGGWGALVDRLVARARSLGVQVETGAKVDRLDDVAGGPVVLALDPRGARRLLGDPSLRPEAPRVALLDVGLSSRRGDPYLVVDLDEAAFLTRPTAPVPSLAPAGEDLAQLSVGMRPGEPLDAAVGRLEGVLDVAFDGWRERTTWARRSGVREATGAVDLPGTTWRDRPAVDRGDGVWLVGDWVAAPGHLAEVSCASAVAAATAATQAATRSAGATGGRRPVTARAGASQ